MNAITHDRANAVAPHFPGRVSDNALLVVEQHAKTAVRQYFVYLAFNDEEFFFRHPFRLAGDPRPPVCPPAPSPVHTLGAAPPRAPSSATCRLVTPGVR